jgi:hypothetical protein
MTAITRILVACLLLLAGSDSWAAGKRKPHGKTPSHSGAAKPAPGGSVDVAPSKGGALPTETRPGEARAPARESVRQESRIEFDERMLRGQSAAGVIYLFQRTPSDWKSIVEVPESFRPRTVEVLTPAEEKK